MSIEGIKVQEISGKPEGRKFDSLESLREYLGQLCEGEKRQKTVSHFTFGEDFNSDELIEKDLGNWNLFQEFLAGGVSLETIQESLRESQVKLLEENMSTSSRGKFYSYLSSRVMGELLEIRNRQRKVENN